MKNLTPQHLKCGTGWRQSVHELEDGRLLIVGQTAGLVADEELVAKPGPDETAIIIDRALLAAIMDEVREECAKIADEFARPIAPGTTAGSVTQMTGESIAVAIRALKETHRAAPSTPSRQPGGRP